MWTPAVSPPALLALRQCLRAQQFIPWEMEEGGGGPVMECCFLAQWLFPFHSPTVSLLWLDKHRPYQASVSCTPIGMESVEMSTIPLLTRGSQGQQEWLQISYSLLFYFIRSCRQGIMSNLTLIPNLGEIKIPRRMWEVRNRWKKVLRSIETNGNGSQVDAANLKRLGKVWGGGYICQRIRGSLARSS